MGILVLLAASAAGCDGGTPMTGTDSGPPGTDSGMSDGGMTDPCSGITQCAAAGTSCDGDTLVTCAPNADGCRIETRMDCTTGGNVCDDSASPAVCASADPCDAIPAAMRCETASRSCDADTLTVCEANVDGCLVLTTTDCAASAGGRCGDVGGTTACQTPADPCADIPAADRCATAGTSCDTDSLVTCAPDAFGCLVQTTTDCTARTGGACDATGSAAICTATDACAGVTTCAAAGSSCVGGALVTCAADAFGCLVETTTDCTEAMFGFCDMDAAGGATCSTGALDPCMGMTTCAAESRMCSTDSLVVCAPNALGCLVETTTDCTADGEACRTVDGMDVCVDLCTLVTECPAATYCDGADVVTCAADGDGCLVESARTTCASGEICGTGGGAAACETDYCPPAAPAVLDCTTGTFMGDTAAGTMMFGGYAPCTTLTSYANVEQVSRFATGATTPQEVQIVATRISSTADYDLFVLDGASMAMCTDADICLDGSTGTTATETVSFRAEPGTPYYVVYDLFSGSATTTTTYSLAITCAEIACGNGVITSDEACDDGDMATGDGCSDTCTVETGFVCYGAPSTCGAVDTCGNGFTETGEMCDDGNTTDGDGCSADCTMIEAPYRCRTSVQPSVCTLPPYDITTIAASCVDTTAGTVLLSSGDDAFTTSAALPFAFPYFGVTEGFFRASTNGFVQLAATDSFSGSSSSFNPAIPSTSTPNGLIAPFWDDLIIGTGGAIRTLTTGTPGSQTFIVDYANMTAFSASSVLNSFQVHFYEATGVIELHYCSITNSSTGSRHTGDSATIGIESPDGTDGQQISFNTADAVMTGSGFRLTPR